MQSLEKIVRSMEAINRFIGKASIWLIFVFMLLMVFEVIMRYFLESPTIWVHESCGYVFAAYLAFTGGWVLLGKGHVSVDILYQYFPDTVKHLADIIVSVLTIGMFSVLFYQGYKFAMFAYITNQHSHTLFAPLLWPIKALLPIGALLFIVQLLADIGKSIIALKGGKVS